MQHSRSRIILDGAVAGILGALVVAVWFLIFDAARGRPLVAIDAVGAGYRETVYWCRGREAALAFKGEVPTEASIVGIVDTITAPGAGANPHPAANPPARAKNHPAGKARKGRR